MCFIQELRKTVHPRHQKQETSAGGGREMVAELDDIKTDYPPLEMALDIRSCASILSSSVKNRYLVKHVLDQEPEDII